MENTFLIKNLSQLVGQEVTINGWVHNFRSSGKIAFWQIRDGSGFCQAILSSDELSVEQWALVEKVKEPEDATPQRDFPLYFELNPAPRIFLWPQLKSLNYIGRSVGV
jgi:hypothetical protein